MASDAAFMVSMVTAALGIALLRPLSDKDRECTRLVLLLALGVWPILVVVFALTGDYWGAFTLFLTGHLVFFWSKPLVKYQLVHPLGTWRAAPWWRQPRRA